MNNPITRQIQEVPSDLVLFILRQIKQDCTFILSLLRPIVSK